MELKFNVMIKVQRPLHDVFDAVYDPQKLSDYFTNGGASGPLDEGATVQWAFADTPGEEVSFPVEVERSAKNEQIVLRWQGTGDEKNRVEIDFTADGENETVVKISESGWKDTQADLDASYRNCMGWSQMLCCLKAYAEHGIDLRKGAYSGLYKKSDHEAKAAN